MKSRSELLFFAGIPAFIWAGYAHDSLHTALSPIAAQPPTQIHWSAPVDLKPQLSPYTGELYVHYGSPAITAANTILIPVKTGAADGFEVQARNGATGTLLYTLTTDYTLPPHDWTPPYGLVLATHSEPVEPDSIFRRRPPLAKRTERLYYPGAGGTVYYRDDVDSPIGTSGQIAFYGTALYSAGSAAFNSAVQISTPLTSDSQGNIYFGFVTSGANPANLTSGIARISKDGAGTWVSATVFAGGDNSVTGVAMNCAPALSPDQRTLYFAIAGSGTAYLVSADSATLTPLARAPLMDPQGGPATVTGDSSASPTVGPDGDVYFGVLEHNCCTSHNDRGWMLHFDASLTRSKIPGSFGWDDTASIVPATAVPSYSGNSSYLILVKYNNYAGVGTGNGVNKLAVLDPNASQPDEYASVATPAMVMREVLTVTGVTPDNVPGFPNAVKEWCINSAAIDPISKAAMVNSEDGVLYRWDFVTNTLSQRLTLTPGLGEAYTPTLIGADGTVYAINDSVLFATGM